MLFFKFKITKPDVNQHFSKLATIYQSNRQRAVLSTLLKLPAVLPANIHRMMILSMQRRYNYFYLRHHQACWKHFLMGYLGANSVPLL